MKFFLLSFSIHLSHWRRRVWHKILITLVLVEWENEHWNEFLLCCARLRKRFPFIQKVFTVFSHIFPLIDGIFRVCSSSPVWALLFLIPRNYMRLLCSYIEIIKSPLAHSLLSMDEGEQNVKIIKFFFHVWLLSRMGEVVECGARPSEGEYLNIKNVDSRHLKISTNISQIYMHMRAGKSPRIMCTLRGCNFLTFSVFIFKHTTLPIILKFEVALCFYVEAWVKVESS